MNAVSSPDVRVNLGCPEGVVNEALRLHGMPDVWLCGWPISPCGQGRNNRFEPEPNIETFEHESRRNRLLQSGRNPVSLGSRIGGTCIRSSIPISKRVSVTDLNGRYAWLSTSWASVRFNVNSLLLGKFFSPCDDLTDPTQCVDIVHVTALQRDADFWQVTEDPVNIF